MAVYLGNEKVSSGGGIGVGSTGGGLFTVNITVDQEENFTADKTFNEIKTAIDSGLICQVKLNEYFLPLVECNNNSVCFNSVIYFSGFPVFTHFIINNDNTTQNIMINWPTK